MSFGLGGLLLSESIEVARLHISSQTWQATLQRAMTEGITSLPKAASRRRTLREIVNRISTLEDQELNFLIGEADRQEQQALLWLATCRAYQFIREFTVEVIQERYLSFQLDLPQESFDVLFAAKAEWDDGLARIRPTTRAKLRQVLFRMMREARVISDNNRIQPAYVSPRLMAILTERNPEDLVLFPGFYQERGV